MWMFESNLESGEIQASRHVSQMNDSQAQRKFNDWLCMIK